MEAVDIIPEKEWRQHLARLERLEAAELARATAQATTAAHTNEVLTVRQAAAHTGLTTEQLRRARREGKLTGVRLNEKDWGFRGFKPTACAAPPTSVVSSGPAAGICCSASSRCPPATLPAATTRAWRKGLLTGS